MTPELTALTLAALLQCLQFVAYAIPANRDLGPVYTMSARDREPSRDMAQTTARLGRAYDNHIEWLLLFAIAVLVTQLSNQNTQFTATCGWIYLGARILYIPAYAYGLKPWRSLIWAVGFLATALLLVAALI
ncbi:MAPEG family protein [Sulfitobacter sp. JB4-11]|uniref:MAPEG family protein n=1 Tax=Sulfitobacter rhodophyticola TaxID=3238304 RepID=UPI003511B443